MKYVLILALALSSACGASLKDITHDAEQSAEVLDEAASKLEQSTKLIRAGLKEYGQMAVALCAQAPVDADACREIDVKAGQVLAFLERADEAVKEYRQGKADLADAYDAVVAASELARDYAAQVVELAKRARV